MLGSLIGREELEAEIRKATGLLARRPGVQRVWLFGSAAQGRRLDWRSDLDFAVEGLPETELSQAWCELDEALKLPVDLVRWESASATLRRQIAKRGRVLHEA